MSYVPKVDSHLKALASAVVDPCEPMWPSVLDVRTGKYPQGEYVPTRVYRLIGAPRGSTLYWDQPSIVAAHALAELTGSPEHALAADAYVRSFLERCTTPTGMFRWGNHMYYDVFEHKVIEFQGGAHELRPITPAWDVFWRLAPERTADHIRAMGRRHVYDPVTGAFNRHDDGQRAHAFIEAGGIIAESLAWLHGKTGDAELADLALRIARYSFRHRDPSTGLMMNEPDKGRWDSRVSTSEVGLWAQCLLRAGGYTSQAEFADMARDAVRAYVAHAWDAEAGRYFLKPELDAWLTDARGRLPTPDHVEKVFQRLVKRSELPRIRLHDLRHSFGSIWAERVPPTVLKEMMGHASITTTERYIHTTDEIYRRSMNAAHGR